MKLDVTMQITFGILSALIAVFGIWLAWHSRGKLLYFLQGLYPAVAPIVWSIHSRLIPYQPETCRRNE
jgi:hypothetical protein